MTEIEGGGGFRSLSFWYPVTSRVKRLRSTILSSAQRVLKHSSFTFSGNLHCIETFSLIYAIFSKSLDISILRGGSSLHVQTWQPLISFYSNPWKPIFTSYVIDKNDVRDDFKIKNGIFNELGIKGGRGVILKHDFINLCNDETWGKRGGGQT